MKPRCRALRYDGSRCESEGVQPRNIPTGVASLCMWHADRRDKGIPMEFAPADPDYPPPPEGEYAGPAAGTEIVPRLVRYLPGPYRAGLQDALIGAESRAGDYGPRSSAMHYAAGYVAGRRYLHGNGMDIRYDPGRPPWPLPPEGQGWSYHASNWPDPGEAFSHGTHFVRDEDEVVIALTWSAERAELLAKVPELVRVAKVARALYDTFPRDLARPEALAAVDALLKAAGY